MVVPTRPQCSQMTESGCHSAGWRTLATRAYTSRTTAARSRAMRMYRSIRPARYSSLIQ